MSDLWSRFKSNLFGAPVAEPEQKVQPMFWVRWLGDQPADEIGRDLGPGPFPIYPHGFDGTKYRILNKYGEHVWLRASRFERCK